MGTLVKAIKNPDEGVIGNAALCLGHCTQVPKVCAALTKTDIIKDLLVLARDGKRPQLQQNCAILLAKLAQGDPRFVFKLNNIFRIEVIFKQQKSHFVSNMMLINEINSKKWEIVKLVGRFRIVLTNLSFSHFCTFPNFPSLIKIGLR